MGRLGYADSHEPQYWPSVQTLGNKSYKSKANLMLTMPSHRVNYKTWTLDWTGLWTGLNYGLTRKMLKLFSIAFYSVVSTTKFM